MKMKITCKIMMKMHKFNFFKFQTSVSQIHIQFFKLLFQMFIHLNKLY
jgi:hypothetical protein